MAIAVANGDKGKADKLFSRIIRFHGMCDNCDYVCPWECESRDGIHRKGCKLQCAHIISRHLSATRCDLQNAFSLCAKCHHRFTNWPVEFTDFILDKRGRGAYDALSHKAQQRNHKTDWNKILNELEEEWATLRAN